MATRTSGTPGAGPHAEADGGPGRAGSAGRRSCAVGWGGCWALAAPGTRRPGCGTAAADRNQRPTSSKEEAVDIKGSRSLQKVHNTRSPENKLCVSRHPTQSTRQRAGGVLGLGGGWVLSSQRQESSRATWASRRRRGLRPRLVSRTPQCLSEGVSRSVPVKLRDKPLRVPVHRLPLSCDALKSD